MLNYTYDSLQSAINALEEGVKFKNLDTVLDALSDLQFYSKCLQGDIEKALDFDYCDDDTETASNKVFIAMQKPLAEW